MNDAPVGVGSPTGAFFASAARHGAEISTLGRQCASAAIHPKTARPYCSFTRASPAAMQIGTAIHSNATNTTKSGQPNLDRLAA